MSEPTGPTFCASSATQPHSTEDPSVLRLNDGFGGSSKPKTHTLCQLHTSAHENNTENTRDSQVNNLGQVTVASHAPGAKTKKHDNCRGLLVQQQQSLQFTFREDQLGHPHRAHPSIWPSRSPPQGTGSTCLSTKIAHLGAPNIYSNAVHHAHQNKTDVRQPVTTGLMSHT